MLITYKYRLYPTAEQEKTLYNTLFICWRLYNECAAEWLDEIRQIQALPFKPAKGFKRINHYVFSYRMPQLKKDKPELQTVYAQVLIDVLRRLDKAFQRYFKGTDRARIATLKAKGKKIKGEFGMPKLGKFKEYSSFTYPQQGFWLTDNDEKLHLSKIGDIEIVSHRPIEGTVKTCTIVKEIDEWYACFSCEVETKPLEKTGNTIAINRGIRKFLTDHTGTEVANPRFFEKSEAKITKHNQQLAKMTPGSKRWKKQAKILAKAHKTVYRQRQNFQHNISKDLINRYDEICTEDFSTFSMICDPLYEEENKQIADVGWRTFNDMLVYKGELYGKEVKIVDSHYISQTCCFCGKIHNMKGQETYSCPDCQEEIDIDVNAAINIFDASRCEVILK